MPLGVDVWGRVGNWTVRSRREGAEPDDWQEFFGWFQTKELAIAHCDRYIERNKPDYEFALFERDTKNRKRSRTKYNGSEFIEKLPYQPAFLSTEK